MTETTEEAEPAAMDTKGAEPTKRKLSLRSMKGADGRYPVWMSTKKIKAHARNLKKKNKRCAKGPQMSRTWTLVC